MTWEELAKFIMEMPEEKRRKKVFFSKNDCLIEVTRDNLTNQSAYYFDPYYFDEPDDIVCPIEKDDWVIE